jgi:hypothetical protein
MSQKIGKTLLDELLRNHKLVPGGQIVAVLDGPKPEDLEDAITGRRNLLLRFVVANSVTVMFLAEELKTKRIESPDHYGEVFPALAGEVLVIEAAIADPNGFGVEGAGRYRLGGMVGRFVGHEDEATPFRISFAGFGETDILEYQRPGIKGTMMLSGGPHLA